MVTGLKNVKDLVTSFVKKYDFAIFEECFKYKECNKIQASHLSKKTILHFF